MEAKWSHDDLPEIFGVDRIRGFVGIIDQIFGQKKILSTEKPPLCWSEESEGEKRWGRLDRVTWVEKWFE